jgi:endonuclease/exonuclease/phosphatase family metal-dependent hydrolase
MNQNSNNENNFDSIDSIPVLSLNLRFGLADDGPNSWKYRKNSFPDLLKKYRADFFGFQEVNDFQSEFLKNILNEYKCIGERKPAPSFWQNNIIFYHRKWKCMYQDHFYLSPTPTIPSRFKDSRWPRQCTIGVFKNMDGELIIANTHFDFTNTVQTQSASLILKRLSKISSGIPEILVGDFNATPQSSSYRIFTGQKKDDTVNRAQFFKNAFKKPFPGTFHGFKENNTGDHIDWILYRGGLVLKKSKVIRGKINGLYPSDHFPLFAVFKRKNEEK